MTLRQGPSRTFLSITKATYPMSIPFVLTAFGLPHTLGYLATQSGERHPSPMTTVGLMDAAVEFGLAGVEIPLTRRVPSFDGKTVDVAAPEEEIKEALTGRGLRVVAAYGVIVEHDPAHLREYVERAAATGATTVRAIISTVLCGDRRKLEGGWEQRLTGTAARLREVLPVAEDLGICIAVENH